MEISDPSERKWHLAMKVLTTGLEPEDAEEWNRYMGDPAFVLEFDVLKKNWHNIATLPYQHINAATDWKLISDRIRAARPRKTMFFLRYAAVFAFVAGIAFYFTWILQERNGQRFTTIEAPAGTRTVVTLPDSSKVWLNADTRIVFDAGFGLSNRDIALEGEAFFDVVHNANPFLVHTSFFDIEVLGTAFNVSVYPDDDEAVTTLMRGSLRIDRDNKTGKPEKITLKPNQKVLLSRDQGAAFTMKSDVDAQGESAWKDGWLSVRGESLNGLARKIERLYDVKINFTDKELQSLRYTGRIKQLSLEQVLKALSLTSPVEFKIDEKIVTLSENKKAKQDYRSLQVP